MATTQNSSAVRKEHWWTWKKALVVFVAVFVLLEIGTYAFNWTWTGFKGNDTVWDYLQLLLLPIALAIMPIWIMAEEAQRRVLAAQLRLVLVISVAILVVLFIGTFALTGHGRVSGTMDGFGTG